VFQKYEEIVVNTSMHIEPDTTYAIFRISYCISEAGMIFYTNSNVVEYPLVIRHFEKTVGKNKDYSKDLTSNFATYNNTALDSSGGTFTVGGFITTDYFELDNDFTLYFNNNGTTSRLLICLFDENKALVQYYEYYVTNGIEHYKPLMLNGKYIRFTYEPPCISNIKVFNYSMNIANRIEQVKNVGVSLFSKSKLDINQALASDGNTFPAGGWYVTDYITDIDKLTFETTATVTVKTCYYPQGSVEFGEFVAPNGYEYRPIKNKGAFRLSFTDFVKDIRAINDDITFIDERIKVIDNMEYKIISTAKGLIEAFEKGGNYFVQSGNYDMLAALGEDYINNFQADDFGILTQSGTYIFAPNAAVKAHYSGDNLYFKSGFSPINLSRGAYDVKFIGLNVECSNVKYGIHDEMGSLYYPYSHEYYNCHATTDNCNRALGGGLGYSGNIIIDGCIFGGTNHAPELDAECCYHNNISAGSKSAISIKNSIVTTPNCGFRFDCYGSSEEITNAIVTNCKCGIEPYVANEAGNANNILLHSWNNVIG
jgi:hypothetical protein